jgi:hypothetical protein
MMPKNALLLVNPNSQKGKDSLLQVMLEFYSLEVDHWWKLGGNNNGSDKGNGGNAGAGLARGTSANAARNARDDVNPRTGDRIQSCEGVEVRHRSGIREVLTESRYVMRDRIGRTIISRYPTPADRARIRSMLE